MAHGVASFSGVDRRDIADRLEQPANVEPAKPFNGRVFHRVEDTSMSESAGFLIAKIPSNRAAKSSVDSRFRRRFDAAFLEGTRWGQIRERRYYSKYFNVLRRRCESCRPRW